MFSRSTMRSHNRRNDDALSGPTHFGFAFTGHDRPIVTEAGAGAVSSFNITDSDQLSVISASVPDTQMASCWISLNNTQDLWLSRDSLGVLTQTPCNENRRDHNGDPNRHE